MEKKLETIQTNKEGFWPLFFVKLAGYLFFISNLVFGLVMLTEKGHESFVEGRSTGCVNMVKTIVDIDGRYASSYGGMRYGLDDFRCNGALLLCTGVPIGLFLLLLHHSLTSKSGKTSGYFVALGIITICASLISSICLRNEYGPVGQWGNPYRGVSVDWYGRIMTYGCICGGVIFLWGILPSILCQMNAPAPQIGNSQK